MSTPVNPPRGMRDFLPEQKAARERVLSVIRGTFSRYGYQEIETPPVEELPRLLSSEGGENAKLIYQILRRNVPEGTPLEQAADLGLRYDLTVPLARFYATNRAALPEVFRGMQIGSVFRAERPQKGRFRQFTQCDLDVLGEPSIIAETELIVATVSTLQVLGLQGCRVRLNDRRLLTALMQHCGFAPNAHAAVLITVDKLDKIGMEGVAKQLRAENHPAQAVDLLVQVLESGRSFPEAPTQDLEAITEAVQPILGADVVRFDPTLVRGMGYYTGSIFELEHPESASSVGGGGRYDSMVGRFAGQQVPACGFSIGFERIVDLVQQAHSGTLNQLALIYDADVSGQQLARVLAVQHSYIAQGWTVRLVPGARRLNRVLEPLVAQGFTHFATVKPGEDVHPRELS